VEDENLRTLDRVTQNCLRNEGKFIIYNSQYIPFCAVDKSNIPSDVDFTCPYHNGTRGHLIDIAFFALGCDYEKE